MERGAPGQARRLYLALSRFFRWCVENHFVASSPMMAVARPLPPRARDRVLTDHEIGLLWKACDSVPPAFAACIRLMVLTGCRRNEAARARWDEFVLSAATWNLPASRSKNKRSHITYLSQQAVDLLGKLPRLGEFVFTTRGDIPLAGFSKVRAALQLRMVTSAAETGTKTPSDDWVFHDLRRSLVSWLAGNGVAVHVADRLLNHVAGSFTGVLGTYQRYEFIEERRRALAAWGRHIEGLAGGTPTASNVITLSAA